MAGMQRAVSVGARVYWLEYAPHADLKSALALKNYAAGEREMAFQLRDFHGNESVVNHRDD